MERWGSGRLRPHGQAPSLGSKNKEMKKFIKISIEKAVKTAAGAVWIDGMRSRSSRKSMVSLVNRIV